jgi:hypothetical protein
MATPTLADRATRTIHDVATIDNGSGRARILFRIGDLSDLGPIVIKHATLRIPLSGDAVARGLDLRVHNLTTDWNPASVNWTNGWTRPGGDFEDGVYGGAVVDLSRGGTTASFDVAPLLKPSSTSTTSGCRARRAAFSRRMFAGGRESCLLPAPNARHAPQASLRLWFKDCISPPPSRVAASS